MKMSSIIETKNVKKVVDEPVDEPTAVLDQGLENEHAEAVALVKKHRDFFEHYARGRIKIEPAPRDVSTFAFNLEENTIYINSMFYKKLGFSEEKTVFATLHEIEHFLEKLQILSEEGGERKFDNYLKRIKASKAFSLMDNCVGDVRENRAVSSKTNQGMRELEIKIYKEDLFAETDFTSQPRHIQFSQSILREARVSDERCQVSPDVRSALDEVAKVKDLMEIMTNPKTPMSMRLKLQDKYIWPKIEALLEKDMEDKKQQKERENKEKGDGRGESGERGEKKDGEKTESNREKEEGEETDPDKIFAKEYAEVGKKFPEAVPMEEIEKALKEWKEEQKGKNNKDKADGDYAERIGVDKKDLQNYRKIAEALERITNPETDMGVIEELRNLFSRIIAKRLKKALAPKYPVEEGDELVDPAQLVAEVKSGNLTPKVWEDTEIKERKGDRFGEVEITFVYDRSFSMTYGDGQKAEEQRKSAVLAMEVLKEFTELCEAEKINIDKPLEIKSEIYGFGAGEDKKPIKKMSAELGEAERINVLKKLYYLPGTTTDFNCLEAIHENLDDKTKTKIKIGELKKIVIVFTDGGSNKPAEVQANLKKLGDSGVVVIALGMTKAGKPVLSTYAPNAQVVEDVSKIPIVLGELLKEHLKDL
ncbi:MAG TPA: VWA domain-containing protein [bacterium]|nr:VWA domain-containing protein [bacterium]